MSRPVSIQMSLFDETDLAGPSEREEAATLVWSYSRRSTLDQCPRQYYYEYYGSHKRTAQSESSKDALRFLKGLHNRYTRAGDILHRAIRVHLLDSQRPAPRSVDQLLQWARDIFRADRDHSRRHPDGDGTVADAKYPPALLSEYHYRLPDADALVAEAEERLLGALRTFVIDERFRAFRAAASYGALVERRFKLNLPGVPCRVDGMVDLAYSMGGQATVVDWKLGASDGSGDDSLQLAVYALWAGQHFGCGAEAVRVCKAHLSSGDVAEFAVSDAVLAAARARITQDALLMSEMHQYGREAVSQAFTPCMQPAICRLCKYRRPCWDGKESSLA